MRHLTVKHCSYINEYLQYTTQLCIGVYCHYGFEYQKKTPGLYKQKIPNKENPTPTPQNNKKNPSQNHLYIISYFPKYF